MSFCSSVVMNLSTAKQTDDLKRQDLQIQMDTAQKQLSYYKIFAPIDGTVVKLDVSAGDAAKAGEVLATVANSSKMEFTIPVDELDIAKIAVGQKTNITVDALTDTTTKPLTGSVSKIALEGTSTNGVTTYPVTVQINETDKLKGGMNANAEIIVNQKTNTLYVPIEAVQKMGNRTFVMVQTDAKTAAAARTQQGARTGAGGAGQYGAGNGANANGSGSGGANANRAAGGANGGNANRTAGGGNGGNYGQSGGNTNRASTGNAASSAAKGTSAQSTYYANAIMKPVVVGISNDTYIEITSGLQQSDIVILPPVSSTTSTNANANRAGGGFGGGGGGFGGGGGASMVTRAAGR